MIDTAALQRTIYNNVAARGYTDGFTNEQFAARQVAKGAEELGEFAECFTGLPRYVRADVTLCGNTCRENFKMPQLWKDARLSVDPAEARKELADMLVSTLSACESLGFDGLAAALEKSAGDVARGVR
jgi:NTP pyrophosphatase (non-canonical NTP hydrolase)